MIMVRCDYFLHVGGNDHPQAGSQAKLSVSRVEPKEPDLPMMKLTRLTTTAIDR